MTIKQKLGISILILNEIHLQTFIEIIRVVCEIFIKSGDRRTDTIDKYTQLMASV